MIATRVTNDMHYLVVASPDYLARRGQRRRRRYRLILYAPTCIRYRLPGGGFITWVFVVDGKTIEFDVEGSVVDRQRSGTRDQRGARRHRRRLSVRRICGVAGGRRASRQSAGQIRVAGHTDDRLLFILPKPSGRIPATALRAFIEFLRTELRTQQRGSNRRSDADQSPRPRREKVKIGSKPHNPRRISPSEAFKRRPGRSVVFSPPMTVRLRSGCRRSLPPSGSRS